MKEEEEETVSRERLLRRGRRTAPSTAAAEQNVEWNFASSAFGKEPKEYGRKFLRNERGGNVAMEVLVGE